MSGYSDRALCAAKFPCKLLSVTGLTGVRIAVKQHISVTGTVIISKCKSGIFLHHLTVFHNSAAGNDCFTFHFDFFFCLIIYSFYAIYFSVLVHQNICDRCVEHILSATFNDIFHGIQTDQRTAVSFSTTRNQIKITMCHDRRRKSICIFRISDILKFLCLDHLNSKTLNILFCSPGIVYILTDHGWICVVVRILIQ